MPTYDAILAQDTQFLTVAMEVCRATHFPLIDAPNTTIPITALIDTGATHTAIREDILLALNTIPLGRQYVDTAAGPAICDQYFVRLAFPDGKYVDNFRVTALPTDITVDCLLGMDILRFGVLIYDGKAGKFSLDFQP
ncbi:MAG: retropepsin-like aspartic protease [Candidatus Poribacteria bacterium]|nr:retropepsin-like aspartic protease [Candidatus Poribacteria bacterium]MDE0506689.1 retropepsin-like aspartic protease [Candidatus Poribacteria bacterium]